MKVKNFIIALLLMSVVSCAKANLKSEAKVSGLYISTKDTKSSIEIRNAKCFMHYEGVKIEKDSIYNIEITDTIKIDNKVYADGKYLKLKNAHGVLKYKINKWTAKTISLIYLPRGNTLTYEKK